MNIGEDLLVILSSYNGGYRLMRRRMSGDMRPALRERMHETSISTLKVTLSRLKKKGLVENHGGTWNITEIGKTFIKKRLKSLSRDNPEEAAARQNGKKMIVIFDIPERAKKQRDWLRRMLTDLGFIIIQKSVWLGPMPLPAETVEQFERMRIIPYLKFFEAKEADIV